MSMLQRMRVVERNAKERIRDFKQVSHGFTKDEAFKEAKRCLQCARPMCSAGCPVEIKIPEFIKHIAENNIDTALKVLKQKNNLPSVCGRVCPQENQCEKLCVLSQKKQSVSIGNLERFAADNASVDGDNIKTQKNNIKIAVIGSGPAGLSCGGDLLMLGYDVTVYESLHSAGGVLRYGIPEFRLPKEILDKEIEALVKLGMKIVLNALIGRTKTIQELFDDDKYKAVFIATGAGLPIFPKIDGENLNHIYSANEFLSRVNLMRAFDFPNYDTPVYKGKNVAVIGGGNTAMDSARTALRLGAKSVKLIYRRTEHEMPARKEECLHAKEEGVEFISLTSPVRFIGNKERFVEAVECVKMELGELDESGRKRSYKIEDSNYIMETDMVILALGLHPNPILPSLTKGLNTDKSGYIVVDDNFMTSIAGVFAGGDIVGGDTVIAAMGMGKKAAKAIDKYIRLQKIASD